MGHQAVAEQCKAIDEWRAQIGKAKQQPEVASTAALEAKIEALCRERMEQAYRDISGALTAYKAAHMGLPQSANSCASSGAHLPCRDGLTTLPAAC